MTLNRFLSMPFKKRYVFIRVALFMKIFVPHYRPVSRRLEGQDKNIKLLKNLLMHVFLKWPLEIKKMECFWLLLHDIRQG